MPKRSSYEIADTLLLRLREDSASYADLQRRLKTNYDTVRMHVEALERYGLLRIEHIAEHPANGQPATKVALTKEGRQVARSLNP